MTLGDMITKALRKAGVIRENQSANAEQNRDAIDTFNGLMSMYDADGIDLGDYPVTVIADELDLEREHIEPVKTIFALALQIDHGLPVDAGLLGLAERFEKFLLRNTFVKPDPNLSHTPLGRATPNSSDILNG